MIIDAHVHIMSELKGRIGSGLTRSLSYGKIQRGDKITRLLPPLCNKTSFPPEILLENMDWVGVEKAVILQGPFYGEANEYIFKAVKKWSNRFIGAGYVDPFSYNIRKKFSQIINEFKFRIIKFELSEEAGLIGLYPDLRIDEEPMEWIWQESEKKGVVVTLDLGAAGSKSYQTKRLKNILDRHPKLKIVITHLAHPPIIKKNDEQFDKLWIDQILLATQPYVWLDLAALPAYSSTEDYPYPTAQKYIGRAIDMVGAEKIMWGTDVPGLLTHATYPQLFNFVTQHCDFLSQKDLKKILGDNAWQVYGNT